MNQPSQTAIAAQAPISEHATTHRAERWQAGQFSHSPDTGRFLTAAERSAVAQLAQQHPNQVRQAYELNVPFEAVGLSIQGVQQPTQAQPSLAAAQTAPVAAAEAIPQQAGMESAQGTPLSAPSQQVAPTMAGQAQPVPESTQPVQTTAQPVAQAQPGAIAAQSSAPAASTPVQTTPPLTETAAAQPTARQAEQTPQPRATQPQTIQTQLPATPAQQPAPTAGQIASEAPLTQPTQAAAQPTQAAAQPTQAAAQPTQAAAQPTQVESPTQTQAMGQPTPEAGQPAQTMAQPTQAGAQTTAQPLQEAQFAQTGLAAEQPTATQQFPAARQFGTHGSGTTVPGPY